MQTNEDERNSSKKGDEAKSKGRKLIMEASGLTSEELDRFLSEEDREQVNKTGERSRSEMAEMLGLNPEDYR